MPWHIWVVSCVCPFKRTRILCKIFEQRFGYFESKSSVQGDIHIKRIIDFIIWWFYRVIEYNQAGLEQSDYNKRMIRIRDGSKRIQLRLPRKECPDYSKTTEKEKNRKQYPWYKVSNNFLFPRCFSKIFFFLNPPLQLSSLPSEITKCK